MAQAVGVDRRTLYKWDLYQAAKKGIKEVGNPPPRGFKTDGRADAPIDDDQDVE